MLTLVSEMCAKLDIPVVIGMVERLKRFPRPATTTFYVEVIEMNLLEWLNATALQLLASLYVLMDDVKGQTLRLLKNQFNIDLN